VLGYPNLRPNVGDDKRLTLHALRPHAPRPTRVRRHNSKQVRKAAPEIRSQRPMALVGKLRSGSYAEPKTCKANLAKPEVISVYPCPSVVELPLRASDLGHPAAATLCPAVR
jgi:hypothetical protein